MTTPRTGRRKRAMKNLVKRGGVWYFHKYVANRRISQSLNTSDLEVAKARRTVLANKAVAQKWGEIEDLQSRRTVATVGQICDCYVAAGLARREVSRATLERNVNAVGNILRMVHGADYPARTAPATVLTSGLLADYQAKFLAAAADAGRGARTVRSIIIQARSVFAKWTRDIYKEFTLPDLASFLTFRPVKASAHAYRLPPAELVERTLEGGRQLRDRPSLSARARYAAFVSTYDLALRAGEAVAMQWDWFSVIPVKDPVTGEITMRRFLSIINRPEFKPKWGKERMVPVSDEVWAHLQATRRQDDSFVLPGGSDTARRDLVSRQLAHWMRLLGWKRSDYPKAAHELRKLQGSRWFTELGAEVAQEWLGHRNVATTCTFYAVLRHQPKALAMDGLRAA